MNAIKRLSVFVSVVLFAVTCVAFPLAESFESGTTGWDFSGAWGLTEAQSLSPTHALTDSPDLLYSNNVDSAASLSASVDLTGETAPSVSEISVARYSSRRLTQS